MYTFFKNDIHSVQVTQIEPLSIFILCTNWLLSNKKHKVQPWANYLYFEVPIILCKDRSNTMPIRYSKSWRQKYIYILCKIINRYQYISLLKNSMYFNFGNNQSNLTIEILCKFNICTYVLFNHIIYTLHMCFFICYFIYIYFAMPTLPSFYT